MKYIAYRLPLILSTGLSSIAAAGAAYYLLAFRHESELPTATAALVLAAVLLPYFLLMSTQVQRVLSAALRRRADLCCLLPVYPITCYLVFAFGTETFAVDSLLRLGLFLFLPLLLSLVAQRLGSTFNLFDALAIFAIWLPFDLGLIKSIWLFPQGDGAYVLNSIVGVSFVVALFVCYRNIANIGYTPQASGTTLKTAFVGFLTFFLIAVPIGVSTGFIHYNGSITPWKMLGAFPGILLFIAIPEELLFRALFQNFLTQKMRKPWIAVVTASIVFGATHLNNGPAPDWRYFLLASIAGGIYGAAYHRTKNLTAPALIHALVDATWVGFFMG